MLKNTLRRSLIALIVLSLFVAGQKPAQSQTASTSCPGLGYQSDQCECPKNDKCEGCPCEPCSADADCACITALRASGGTISGTVKVSRTKVKTEGPKSDKDVVLFLEKVGDNNFPPPSKHAIMDQKGLVFIPHVVAIQKGATVDFLNSDNDKHNVTLLDEETGKSMDLGTWNPGVVKSHTFQDRASFVALCQLHLEMAAYTVVLDNPYFTIASIDGESQQATYTIRNVPPGKYALSAWHKDLKLQGGPQEVIVETGKTSSLDVAITKAKYAQ